MISRWRTLKDVRTHVGLVGPNAILQMLPLLDALGGPAYRAELLAGSGLSAVPDGSQMIPETDAACLHRHLRLKEPERAPQLAHAAGLATGDYILANRIPKPAQWVLKALPAGASAQMLSRAIEKHAWTFVGSGRFRVVDPWTFEIAQNPLIKGETSETCLCHWHVGVFKRLYRSLVAPQTSCVERSCCAQTGADCCRFELAG